MTEYSDDIAEKNMARMDELGSQFVESQQFSNLSETQKENAEFILSVFADYMFSYHGELIGKWTVSEVKDCCCNTLPRKVSAGDDCFKAISPVLIAFFNFLEEQKIIKQAKKFTELLTTIEHKIVANSQNSSYWGMAKSFFMGGKKSGFDMSDEEDMSNFFPLNNQQALGTTQNTTPIVKAPSVGRNELCPCGSGKKYKKCCLNSSTNSQ